MNQKKLLLQIFFVVLLVTPLSNKTVGNVLFRTNDGSNDIVRVSDDKVKDFHTYAKINEQNRDCKKENVCGWQCRQAMRTRLCGGLPADLSFCYFLVKQKVEKENMNGRLYDPVIGRFFSPDNIVQLPEFSQSFNRYSYCLNNPLKYVDPSGMLWVDDDYGLLPNGQIKHLRDTYDDFDRLIVLDAKGRETNEQMTLFKNHYKDKSILYDLWKSITDHKGQWTHAISNSPNDVGDIFLFASKHSNVEWGLAGFRTNEGNRYTVYTDHRTDGIRPAEDWLMFQGKTHIFGIHSHPGNNMNDRKASGFGDYYTGDMARITEYYNNTGQVPNKYIYHPHSESLIKYTPWNPQSKIKTGIKYPGGLLFLYK